MLIRFSYLPSYSAVTLLTAIAKFFIVTLLIRSIGANEFGRWSLFEPVVVVLSQLALLGVNFGLIKQINQDKLSPVAAVRSHLLSMQPVQVIICFAVFLVALRLGLAWPGPLYLALLLYVESLFLLLFSSYRASGSIGPFAVSSLAKVLVMLVVCVLALKYRKLTLHNAEDVIFWSLWASLAGLALGFLAVRLVHPGLFFPSEARRESNWRTYTDAIKYGLPLLATGLLAMVIDFMGRYILDSYLDHGKVASFVIHAKISSPLEVLVIAPFGLWWPTERFRELESRDGGRRFFRMVSVSMLAVLLVAAGNLWIISEWIVSWFAPGVAFDRNVALLLIISTVARGMAYPLNIGALKEGKTHWNILGVLAAAIIDILLCFLLIPAFGIVGAAFASMLGYSCYTVFLTLISQRIHPLPLPYAKMLGSTIISILLLISVQRYLGMVSILLKAIAFSSLSLLLYTPLVLPLFREKHGR